MAAQAVEPRADASRRLRKRVGPGRIAFQAGNYTLMALYAAVCFIPLLHILAVSFSTGAAAVANLVGLWPVGFNTKAYEFVATRVEFLRSVGVSFLRLGAALPIYMVFNCITPTRCRSGRSFSPGAPPTCGSCSSPCCSTAG